MADFNDFGFSTVSEDEYKAQQTTEVNTAKAVVSTATASMKPELEKIESKIAGLTDSMRVLSDEMSDRKEELNDKWGTRMNEVEEFDTSSSHRILLKMVIKENGLSGLVGLTFLTNRLTQLQQLQGVIFE